MKNKKQVYIMLTNTDTWLSKAIRMYTHNTYNHTSLSFDENLRELYSFGRKIATNPFVGGFIKEDIKGGTFAHFKNTTGIVYVMNIEEEQYIKLKQVINKFIINGENYKYSLIGLFGIMINKPIQREHSYFCSQFVAYVLKESGINLFDKPPALVTPADFQTLKELYPIYEGKLTDYNSNYLYTQYDSLSFAEIL